MEKMCVIIILNPNTFTIDETLFQTLVEVLLTISQNKTKMREKDGKCLIFFIRRGKLYRLLRFGETFRI